MKTLFALLAGVVLMFSTAKSVEAGRVRGYSRSNGTYVQPYYRANPNYTVRDNYSYKYNYNPYNGNVGTNYYRSSPSSAYYRGRR